MKSFKNKALAFALSLPLMGLNPSVMAATDGTLGATSTGTFGATLNVTAVNAPTMMILGLDDVDFGTIDQSNLSTPGSYGPADYFCIVTNNITGNVNIKYEQDGVMNANIGPDSFALVGPARSGTLSGFAQIPLAIVHASYAVNTGVTRGVNLPTSTAGLGGESSCNNASTQNQNGFVGPTKPSKSVARSAADPTSPAGTYTATIRVTVSPF